MRGMLKRNLSIYFRDKTAVFFSLFGALLIIVLYALFLGDTMTDSIQMDINGAFIMNSWVMGGLIAAATMTTGMGAYGVMVNDESNKNYRDFYTSPVKKSKIIGAYMLNSIAIGVIMTLVTFALAEIYIVANEGELLTTEQALKVIGVILLTVLSSSSIVGFVCTFLRSSQAFSGCSILIGASIGFLVGAYVPIGHLPDTVQKVMSFLPCTHSAALLRQIMTETAIETGMKDYPAEFIQGFREELGIIIKIGDTKCTPGIHLAFIIGSAVLFYLLSLIRITFFKKTK
ncbi:ABC transporter permease [Butyrivibrio sp. YAB3001]|uniref:ABC transporter permease n=1 Tax=Butyrivibrio sp. YAB3001 TaxID=1520812 RepID=UPI0008F6620E|nr:ABC transporter permease [Butyrivibrio sp. YAB3001]SFC21260.1 multidrug/hemolysin transport system permease protein [Butyrivibrio sp. YAB3001]